MSVKDISKTKSNKTDAKTTEDPAAGQQEKTFNQVAYMNEYNRNNYDRSEEHTSELQSR